MSFIREHPELLDKRIDPVFQSIIANICKQGKTDADIAEFVKQRYQLLQLIRQGFNELQAQQPATPFVATIQQAQAAQQRYLIRGDVNGLDEAITAWQQVLQHPVFANMDIDFQLKVLNNSAATYLRCYKARGQLNDLTVAISIWETAVAKTLPDSPDLPSRLNNLGNGLSNRYLRLGDLNDLQAGIDACQQAVAKTPPDSPDLPMYLNNLSNGLSNRYLRLGDPNDLQAGIDACQQAVAKTLPDSPYLPMYLNSLGNELSNRYSRLGDLNDLHAGIGAYQQALAKTSPDSPYLPNYLNGLGIGLWTRYKRLGALEDLQAGIDAFQQALAKTLADSPDLPSRLSSLGNGLKERYKCLGDLNDLQAGINAFQRASQLEGPLLTRLYAVQHWLNWAFERDSWTEIERAYPLLKTLSDQLVMTQGLREHKESFLADTQGLAVKAAYAHIQTNALPSAVKTLEQGVARLLSAALMRSRADLNQLQRNAPELATAYQQHLTDYEKAERAYQHAPVEHQKTRLQEFQEQRRLFDELLERIRQHPGQENFLRIATDIKVISQASQTLPLIYLFTTAKGGYALIVFQGKVRAVALPELTETALFKKMKGYLGTIYLLRDQTTWFKVLDDMTQWLWQVIWQPLLTTPHPSLIRRGIDKTATSPLLTKEGLGVVLIPVGVLNLLPLHAAWTPDATKPSGKRYVLDDFTISYAPNALSLQKARKRATLKFNNILAIDEPLFAKAGPLPSSKIEVNALTRHFAKPQILRQAQATVDNVKKALTSNYDVLHFSCHGSANRQDPLKTGLLMAKGEILTVQDFFDAQLQTRLVTLSACETGMIGTKQVEEVVSLPTSLLQAGVAGVVASLWSVADITTMLLMVQFYQRWHSEYPDNPAEALRQAQQWVRDSKPSEKTAFLRTILPKTEADELRKNMGVANYAHPYYWAAFTFTGV